MGRPSKYDADLAQRVLDAMLDGTTTLEACRQVGIKRSTFNTWVRDDRGGLEGRYTRAQEFQMDAWGDDMMEIVDSSPMSCNEIERQMRRMHARCEKIRARHARVEAAEREKRIAEIVADTQLLMQKLVAKTR